MKYFKIILGILILLGTGKEYANASRQLLNYFDPSIIFACLLMIFFSTWLIGSGFSKVKLKLNSSIFVLYFGIACIACAGIALVSLSSYKFDSEIIKSNGIEVDIAEFMNGSKMMIPDKADRLKYCVCTVDKLTHDPYLAGKHSMEFKEGKIDKILNSLEASNMIYKYNLVECYSSINNFVWTPTFENSIRSKILQELSQSNLSETNDIQKYCNCLIEKYKKMPAHKFFKADFFESSEASLINATCNENSKLKK